MLTNCIKKKILFLMRNIKIILKSKVWTVFKLGFISNALCKDLCGSFAPLIAPEDNRPDTVVSFYCSSI